MPAHDVELDISTNFGSKDEETQENLWMCGASKTSMVTDGSKWHREVQDESFILVPYPEEKFEPVEWSHCLVSIDVCTMNHGTKFCDKEGYDIIPI